MNDLLADQAGTVSRRQLIEAGVHDQDIRRLVRRRDLTPILPGVFVDHTGEPTWLQRAWSGVLYAWPAALAGESALRAAEGPGRRGRPDDEIVVAVDHARKVRGQPGVIVQRRRGLDDDVLWNRDPPRIRYEDAALDVAIAAENDLAAIAALSSACGTRRTTAQRLLTTVQQRERVPRRAWVTAVLRDVADGTCSVLEHGYLNRVERAHGLPQARRQLRALTSAGPVYRDAEVADVVVVELDGRLFHDSTSARDRDMERDLDTALGGQTTIRLGWGQVFDRPCVTAGKIGKVLTVRGWPGTTRPCGASCAATGNIPAAR